uniref:AlNc14C108G6291 protein n=1 Tax=Albugo laibachii Nc14 TaxID=890382 RepID=F0WI84_9STRA|nr:AlNc14C108G6291 [Albugo laibachii Nc14]|eukprot:CCA20963.1 AlNc14C108G6291 [Albugo laibachii Nc14]
MEQLSNPVIKVPSFIPSEHSNLTQKSKAKSGTQKEDVITTVDKAQAPNTSQSSDLEISVDTCKHCMQKWTDCYCNEDGMNLMSACRRFLPYLDSQNSLGKELLKQDDESSGGELSTIGLRDVGS